MCLTQRKEVLKMIKEFVDLFNENREELKKYLKETEQREYPKYIDLVRLLIEKVINKGEEKYDKDSITEIDNGYFQGTLLYTVPRMIDQPNQNDYILTYVNYGSCSGCDTLLGISRYDMGLPTDEQVEDYLTLLLHLIQQTRYLIPRDSESSDE